MYVELVAVNQQTAALQSLQEIFTSKRFKSTPLASLEPIMLKFVELCVNLRKTRSAKDGLLQYKNISQNFSIQSIELVLNKFLSLSQHKVIEAKRAVQSIHPEPQQSTIAVDDLEAAETPESILMSAVSSDQNRDRTERAVVTPWLKYLWDAYRTALDTLRNNARLEILYQQIANEAFKFCLSYSRKTEFRRLCELLRSHVATVTKFSHQAHSINLGDTETLQRHLDTRFAQLSAAVELELWQEAFRSVEDIHNLLTIAKKSPRSSIMAEYYEKLTRIFLVADNRLFHAAAYSRYYSLVKSTVNDQVNLADYVLLSALSVPVHISSSDDAIRANQKLSSILSLQSIPTRDSLLKDAITKGVINKASNEVRTLYKLLEVDFHPLQVCQLVSPIIASIDKNEQTKKYVQPLQNVILTRLFEQLAQIYDHVDIDHVLNLVKPLGNGLFGEKEIEKFLIGSCAVGVKIKIDHVKKSIAFQEDLLANSINNNDQVTIEQSSKLQPTPGDIVRNQLSSLSNVLQISLNSIDKSRLEDCRKRQEDAFAYAIENVEDERKAYIYRRVIVARRRELAEESSARREKEDNEARAQRAKFAAAEQSKREHEEGIRKEQERRKREMEQIRIDEARKLAQNLAEKSGLKVDVNVSSKIILMTFHILK